MDTRMEANSLKRKLIVNVEDEFKALKQELSGKCFELYMAQSKIQKQEKKEEELKAKINAQERFGEKKSLDNDLSQMKILKQQQLVKRLKDKLECAVCLDIPQSIPVPVCQNGHFVCKKCKTDSCPTCITVMGTGSSLLTNTVLDNINHKCNYQDCSLELPLRMIEEHEAVCANRTVRCPHVGCGDEVPLCRVLTMASNLAVNDFLDDDIEIIDEDVIVPLPKKEHLYDDTGDVIVICEEVGAISSKKQALEKCASSNEDDIIVLNAKKKITTGFGDDENFVPTEYFEVKAEVSDINDNELNFKEDEISVVYESNAEDVKTRIHETNPEIEVKYISQITGFDLNCKEKLEMISLGLPCHLGRTREKFVFWCRICQVELNCEDSMVSHIKGNKHNKERLKKKQRD